MERLLAIGDIHGCLTAFDTVLEALELARRDTLVLLGDYVDRGPDSRGVMERILELRTRCNLVPLLGNHEEMMCDAAHDNGDAPGEAVSGWLLCGGEATLASYGAPHRPGVAPMKRLAAVPDEHWRFLLRQCRDYHETPDFVFVHATVLPEVSLAQQPRHALRWRKLHDPQPHRSGKTVVVGHTRQPQGRPHSWGHTIAIDTGAYANSWLTAIDLNTQHVWQANQAGELRDGSLHELGVVA